MQLSSLTETEDVLKQISACNKLYLAKLILVLEWDFYCKSEIQVAKAHLKYLSQFPFLQL